MATKLTDFDRHLMYLEPRAPRPFIPSGKGLDSHSRGSRQLGVCPTRVGPDLYGGTPLKLRAGFDAIRESDLRANLSFVASDALAGRLSLRPGDDAAVEWIASEFAKASLTPEATYAAGKPSFLQPLDLVEYKPDRPAATLTLSSGSSSQTVWHGPEILGAYKDDIGLTAPLVFAGYGITAPELNYDDYKNIDVKGKIVLVFDHEPQETDPHSIFNGTGNTRHATTRVKLLAAQAHGAIAVLIVAEPNRNTSPTPSVPPALAEARPRASVRCLLPGSDPSLAPETILISAHHDHDGENPTSATLAPDQIKPAIDIWHGADDNGSGTVGVVELAHAFAANTARPKRSILFVVFASEERGLLGSYYMAAHPLRPLATTRAMINFDMIGRNEAASPQTDGLIDIPADTTNRLNLIGALYSPDYDRIVKQENTRVGLVLDDRFDHESALNVFFRSDQFPFVLKDIPAFWWFTGFHPGYHHTTDTAEKINYEKMAKILKLAYLSAWNFGDAAPSAEPKFIANPGGSVGGTAR